MTALQAALLLAGACAFLLPAVLALAALIPGVSLRRVVHATTGSFVLAVVVALGGAAASLGPVLGVAGTSGVRLDLVTSVAIVLVATLALVIARFSRRHLDGEPRAPIYARWLLLALSAITVLVVADHLLVIAFAWTATSLALHRLLTFFPERPRAQLAAHQKFVVSRVADACSLGALAIIAFHVGSLDLDAVDAWASELSTLPPAIHGAALLLVAAVSLKSAQLPFHGWLIQVMEAPTPVSALLHAGVVNVGGLLLIRLAPLFALADGARTALVAIGMVTAVGAALVMATRTSVKVGLAWSTCAQMGFMLVECGLGAWHLALLHLAAHSLYKAHAFLGAGGAVERWRTRSLAARATEASHAPVAAGRAWAAAALVALIASVITWSAAALDLIALDALSGLLVLLLSIAFAPLLARAAMDRGTRGGAAVLARAAGATTLYLAWHVAFEYAAPHASAVTPLGAAIVALGLLVLFALQSALEAHPDGAMVRALHPSLRAGLHLDDMITRAVYRLWPPRPVATPVPTASLNFAEQTES